MIFTAPFIKSRTPFRAEKDAECKAPIFRRKFRIEDTGHALLQFCALGYGYCYINGKEVTKDLFIAPTSEYDKMVWYHTYDVSDLVKKGENIIAVILGNGFFNETIETTWYTHTRPWRDNPKFALSLIINGDVVLESDEEFLYTEDSFVLYNQLRSGEIFDAGRYHADWKKYHFDDSAYINAVIDTKTETVKRYLCECEPIREFEEYDFVNCQKTEEGYLLDFGVNIAGYLKTFIDEAPGTRIELFHAEEAYPDGRLKLNRLDIFQKAPFQRDIYICGDKPLNWSPKFTYHGFRYVLIKGLTKAPNKGNFKAVFVHQAIEKLSEFECSDELINKIYDAGIRSSFSNMHYTLTDCPTREKLGWTNDAQSSIEHLYINFHVKKFFEKWEKEICADMDEAGAINAVIPDYGTFRTCGPVADGVLVELPLMHYLYTADNTMLCRMLPYIKKYYDFFLKREVPYMLGDWDGHKSRFKDDDFIFHFYNIKFCDALMLAQNLVGEAPDCRYSQQKQNSKQWLIKNYILENGYSKVESQTVIALLLTVEGVDKKPLLEQLKQCVEKDHYHITCGMWGLQYIYKVLFENGLGDLAYKMITVKGAPSFNYWFENGATTLWETWEEGHTDSRNHHMLSGVLAWFFKGLLGVHPVLEHPGYKQIALKPSFVQDLHYCKGKLTTPFGEIKVSWERQQNQIVYAVTIPEGVTAVFQGNVLIAGENTFILKDKECL